MYVFLFIYVCLQGGPQKEIRWNDVQEVLSDREQLPVLRTRPGDLQCDGVGKQCSLETIVYNYTEQELLKNTQIHINWYELFPRLIDTIE